MIELKQGDWADTPYGAAFLVDRVDPDSVTPRAPAPMSGQWDGVQLWWIRPIGSGSPALAWIHPNDRIKDPIEGTEADYRRLNGILFRLKILWSDIHSAQKNALAAFGMMEQDARSSPSVAQARMNIKNVEHDLRHLRALMENTQRQVNEIMERVRPEPDPSAGTNHSRQSDSTDAAEPSQQERRG